VKSKEYDISEVTNKQEKELDNIKVQLAEIKVANTEILTKLNEKPQKSNHRKKTNHTIIQNEPEKEIEQKIPIVKIKPIELTPVSNVLSINETGIKAVEIVKEKVDKSVGTSDHIESLKEDKFESKEEAIPINNIEEVKESVIPSVSKEVIQPKKLVILSKVSPITSEIIINKEINNKPKDVLLNNIDQSKVENSPEESVVASKRSQSESLESEKNDLEKVMESLRVEFKEDLKLIQSYTNE